jgi:tetratricopeptide (TPR) repeat protein
MRVLILAAAVVTLAAYPVDAQQTEAELRGVIQAAGTDSDTPTLLAAANAARLLREYETAARLYEDTWNSSLDLLNAVISNMLLQELASGGGVDGVQRRFREIRAVVNLTPQLLVGHLGNYPSLLVGGEFDEMVLSLSRRHPDPQYRCSCYGVKAWVHRVAGRTEQARIYFDSLAMGQEEATAPGNPDAAAEGRAQLARNLARAGRTDDARRVLADAMVMPVSAQAMPAVRRRWAQAYAELGDVEGAVEHLEPLLSIPSLISVHTLETRLTWEPVRDHPAFRAMLDRHRN